MNSLNINGLAIPEGGRQLLRGSIRLVFTKLLLFGGKPIGPISI
jgi:hypothetical protein